MNCYRNKDVSIRPRIKFQNPNIDKLVEMERYPIEQMVLYYQNGIGRHPLWGIVDPDTSRPKPGDIHHILYPHHQESDFSSPRI